MSLDKDPNKDPNVFSWSQYLEENDSEDDSGPSSGPEEDFRGDILNDADWDTQGTGCPSFPKSIVILTW
jgi:hypothetical protein